MVDEYYEDLQRAAIVREHRLALQSDMAKENADLRTRLQQAEARASQYSEALRAIAESVYRGPHPTALRKIARAALGTPGEEE